MPDTEILATSKIEATIAVCPRLKSYIDKNDKTPLTDGFIDLYQGMGRNNDEFVGRVPVQVKGRSIRSGVQIPNEYTMSQRDLVALRQHGTVLFFVVYIDEANATHARYVILSPFAIDRILRAMSPKRRSARVEVKEVPESPSKLEGIVTVAHATKKQQWASGLGGGLENVAALTVHSVEGVDLSRPVHVSPKSGDFAIEVRTESGDLLPLSGDLMIYPGSYLEHEIDLRVESGGIAYQNPTVRQVDDDEHELKLSAGLTLRLRGAKHHNANSVNLTFDDNLPARVKDMDFFLNIMTLDTMTYNGAVYRFRGSGTADVDELRAHRDFLGMLVELLEKLHVNPDLIALDEITDAQHDRLQLLHASLVAGADLFAADGKVGHVYERIGRWTLMLLVFPGKEPQSWRYVDPFDPENRYQFKIYRDRRGTAEEWPATAYEGVKPSKLPSILNLRLESVVDAYKVVAELPETTSLANHRVLALIAAADQSPPRREEFLRAATALNDWLIENDGLTPTHRINRWQIIFRSVGLDRTDRNDIRGLRHETSIARGDRASQIDASCAILLGDQEDLESSVSRLSDDERREMTTWPIWTLFDAAADGSELAADE